ncbi:hypothetical protein EB796_013167 [Bugula neritina]|uniref:Uncharacterized protein n=1 Tax=Bugula neritina TaxID=10212 RepID=A0A7J7JR91_BUGNE|nr:hypothetical protein EB796_013167 [Bugula neritina]
MGNSLNCASGNSAGRSSSKYKSNMTEKKDCKFVTEIPGDDTLERTVAPDVLPIEAAHMARQRRFSRRSLNESNPSSPKPTNNNDKPEVFTFETAFRMSQLHSNSPPMVTIPITPSPITATSSSPITATSCSPITATISDQLSTRNAKDSCYVNIKPFMFPLPPLPPDMPPNSEDGSHSFVSVSSAEVIPQEEVTPPTFRRNSPRAHCLEESFNMESPKLPPKPSHLSLPRNISPEQIADNSSIESAAKSPPPRKVVFTDLGLNSEGCVLPPGDPCCKSQAMEPQVSTAAVKKGPKKPPRNYSYKASTLPKRISHTTEEVMELWDEVRKALSLEKIGDTTSVHISEEEEDADDLYQNLYAARMRSWQIMCLSQDVLVDRLKPDRVWECFLNESLVNEAEMEALNLSKCSQRESSQLSRSYSRTRGWWFDRLRENFRVHEDQRLISNLLETLNDVSLSELRLTSGTFLDY